MLFLVHALQKNMGSYDIVGDQWDLNNICDGIWRTKQWHRYSSFKECKRNGLLQVVMIKMIAQSWCWNLFGNKYVDVCFAKWGVNAGKISGNSSWYVYTPSSSTYAPYLSYQGKFVLLKYTHMWKFVVSWDYGCWFSSYRIARTN